MASDGTNSAPYSYISNSPLVGKITFAHGCTTMITPTIEITIIPQKEDILNAVLLSRGARLRKWYYLIGILMVCETFDEVVHGTFDLKKQLLWFSVVWSLWTCLVIFTRHLMKKRVRRMLKDSSGPLAKTIYVFTESTLSVNIMESHKLPWSKVDRIIASSKLIVFSSREIIAPLPISDISEEARVFLAKIICNQRVKLFGWRAKRFFSRKGVGS